MMNAYSALRSRATLTLCRVGALLFGLAMSTQLAFAQATVTGTISNSATGQNLEGARVGLKGTAREAITDNQGVYRFDNVPRAAQPCRCPIRVSEQSRCRCKSPRPRPCGRMSA